jgi:hypothetical protein
VSWKQIIKQSWKGGMTGALLAVLLGLSLRLLDFRLGENLIHLSYDIPFCIVPQGNRRVNWWRFTWMTTLFITLTSPMSVHGIEGCMPNSLSG